MCQEICWSIEKVPTKKNTDLETPQNLLLTLKVDKNRDLFLKIVFLHWVSSEVKWNTNKPLPEACSRKSKLALSLVEETGYQVKAGGCVGSVSNGRVNIPRNSVPGRLWWGSYQPLVEKSWGRSDGLHRTWNNKDMAFLLTGAVGLFTMKGYTMWLQIFFFFLNPPNEIQLKLLCICVYTLTEELSGCKGSIKDLWQ